MARGIPRALTKARAFLGGGGPPCCTHREARIAAEHATAWHFGNEGFVKTNFCVKGHEKSIATAFHYF